MRGLELEEDCVVMAENGRGDLEKPFSFSGGQIEPFSGRPSVVSCVGAVGLKAGCFDTTEAGKAGLDEGFAGMSTQTSVTCGTGGLIWPPL